MLDRSPRILIAAGGTGGHIFPAMAVANELMQRGVDVRWLGTPGSMEARLVPQQGLEIDLVQMKGVRGKGVLQLLKAPFMVARALWQALALLRRFQPDCVLGMGGYVTAPAGMAAKLLGIPLVIHEQNAVAGMSNRLLSKISSRTLEAFEGTFTGLNNRICTGNPVRQDIASLEHLPLEESLRVLVVGGSLGALAINQVMPEALKLVEPGCKIKVWHQTGQRDCERSMASYRDNHLEARVEPFIEDMAAAYSWADLVICRAGALTIAELACAQLPSILVPFPFAVDDHQTANARHLSDRGAAVLLPQNEMTKERVAALLTDFASHREQLKRMAAAASTAARVDATRIVTHQCLEVAHA
ncbi:undecaprenyldiphospho-muramoylpentapeptide beta-N-acetylglucosaminyltransferase [Aestuariirhabdus litorea]|uniref:UDP-N-acetylglucosamine--N-acetylmuramyl-(pentapeptide) pyrophosphoryl-undecaprenol N-acetylglucosamine transferase n=1 Tax=Aestuariirhabdus litorea TaxID=2528527 RepID=A0A3P3VSB8_9GAMM|nr:undecaprenyldiphospho-muramoylpentapeptide beta-N-acetylglucosaminyltransferase [Aestuariirhabdus litorea]RRJ85344.1 undecaprenyldiphospho-muramoylpentapeptide beta-N-acetylglucosaminyltransferase [Aestuariirhabdus litorea]RWW98568.1 undecaprenyldiphospho-muramoylpentapeptide beta-N-acetylglucosaminyltransferase [Endozoicomonadaceae bacterium GTF-13]